MIKRVILITVDALRRDYLGYHNPIFKQKNISPNLDKFFDKSIVFDQAISQGPYTKAVFPAVFYSQYPSKITEKMKLKLGWGQIKQSAQSWLEILQKKGIKTAGFTTNPLTGRLLNYDKGFDRFDDRNQPFSFFLRSISPKLDKKLKAIVLDKIGRKLSPTICMDSPYINQLAFKRLNETKDQKSFLWLHYMDVHGPYYGNLRPEPLSAKNPDDVRRVKKAYFKSVQYFDQSFKKLINYLKKNDILNETAIVLTADHGDLLGEHGFLTHPARFYENLLRVPLAIYTPKKQAKKVKDITGLIDIGPTILDLFKIEEKLPASQGKSLIGYLNQTDPSPVREAIISESYSAQGPPQPDLPANYSLRTDQYKLNVYLTRKKGPKKELFDIKADPQEKNDLIDQKPDIAQKLEEKFKEEYG